MPEMIYGFQKKWYDKFGIGGSFYGIDVYWG